MRDRFEWKKHVKGLLSAFVEMLAVAFVAFAIVAALGGLR